MTLEEQPSQTDNVDDEEDDEDAADMEAFEVSGMLDEQDKVKDNWQEKNLFKSINYREQCFIAACCTREHKKN